MAAVEIPSTAINIPNAGAPSTLFATKRKRGRPQKKKIPGSNTIENLDELLSSSPDSKEPKLSLDSDQNLEDFLPATQSKTVTPSTSAVEASSSSIIPSSSSSNTTPTTTTTTLHQDEHKSPENENLVSKPEDSSSSASKMESTKTLPPSPKQLRKKKAKAKAKAKKAALAVTTTSVQQQEEVSQLNKEEKQEVATESNLDQPQPRVVSPQPVSVLKQTASKDAASSGAIASEKSEENESPLPSTQWKINLSIIEGTRKYVIEKQALPCFERPSIINCAKLPLAKEVEGQWFIVRQDRSFSKPLPAQLENIAKTRETRQTNQKSFTKSRPPSMPKKGQLVIECSVSGNQSEAGVQPESLTYIRNIAFDSGVTTTGAKTNLHLHYPLADNEAQDVVIVGAKGGCIHAISLFVPSSDLTPAWQRLLKSRSESEEESNDEESSSPVMKKRKEDYSGQSLEQKALVGVKGQESPSQKRRKVVWAEDVNVRYYIGPASTKKFTKKHKNLQLDRCADVKLKCSDKVAKKKGINYKFQQLELQPIPGIAGSSPPSPPLKSARTGSPPPPSMDEVVTSLSSSTGQIPEDEDVDIVGEDFKTTDSLAKEESGRQGEETSAGTARKEKEDVPSVEPLNSESSQENEDAKRAVNEDRRQEKAVDECSMTERKTEESSLS